MTKLEVLMRIANDGNIEQILAELKECDFNFPPPSILPNCSEQGLNLVGFLF
jgi:hypothetical protein